MAMTVGLDNKLYKNTGTYGSPTWTEMTSVKDLSMPIEKNSSPATSRASAFEMMAEGLIKIGLNFTMLRDADATGYGAIRAAAIARGTTFDMAIASGAIATTGTVYLRADFAIFGFTQKEDLEDPVTADVTANLIYSSHSPAVTTV